MLLVIKVKDFIVAKPRSEIPQVNDEEAEDSFAGDYRLCSVCLDEFRSADDDRLLVILPCNPNHIFHKDCFLTWFNENNTCPLDQQRITITSLNEQ